MLKQGDILQHRYELIRVLGEGALATAFEARDLVYDESIALKWLRNANPKLLRVFQNEFLQLRGLFHPNLCALRDFGIEFRASGNLYFFTTDLIDGVPLSTYSRDKDWEQIADQIRGLLQALDFLHRLGIRHGDVKSSNVLVDKSDKLVLIDLSCSRPFGRIDSSEVSGTMAYLAPELLASEPADGRADLFAVGVLLSKLLPELRGEVPDRVAKLVQRLMAPLARRPSDCREVIELLHGQSLWLADPVGRKSLILGRQEQIETFRTCLDQLLAGDRSTRAIHITGREGIGRSRLLLELKWMAQQRCEVVEGQGGGDEPMRRLFERALGNQSLPRSVSAVLDVHAHLVESGTPKLLLVDDVHKLPEPEQNLWFGLMRLLTDFDPVMAVSASAPLDIELGETIQIWTLEPLDKARVAQWVTPQVAPSELDELMVHTGGYPGSIDWILCQLMSGISFKQAIATPTPAKPHQETSLRERLSPDLLTHLALLALHEETLEPDQWPQLQLRDEALMSLTAMGWARRGERGFTLQRASDAYSILEQLPKNRLRQLRKRYLQALQSRISRYPKLLPLYIQHLFLASEKDQAEKTYRDARDQRLSEPWTWTKVARMVFRLSNAIELRKDAVEVLLEAGEPNAALACCDDLLQRRLSPVDKAEVHKLRGSCLLRLGRNPDAAQALNIALELLDALPREADPKLRCQAVDQLSRVRIALSEYREAFDLSMKALERCDDPSFSTQLKENLGLASAYMGQSERADAFLSEAILEYEKWNRIRALVRVYSYRAIADVRQGKLSAAVRGYRRALELSQQHGLDDQWASASLNLGTALHQQGDWGQALEAYEQAMRLVLALGKNNSERILRFDLAQLYADIGLFERCSQMLDNRFHDPALELPKAQLLAEVNLAQGAHRSALSMLETAERLAIEKSDLRQLAEALLLRASIQIDAGQLAEADRTLRDCHEKIDQLDARDLQPRHQMLSGRHLMAQAKNPQALDALEAALQTVKASGFQLVEADILRWLYEVSIRLGTQTSAAVYQDQAQIIWRRVFASLPPQLAEAFWQHPRRVWLKRPPEAHSSDDTSLQLKRFLEINSRINSSLSVSRVLTYAMDAAIELTRAERGFVLLKKEESDTASPASSRPFRVAIARNIDREQVSRSYTKFSRSIAERVVQSEQPVVTTNAQDDARFAGERSIHAMQLKSVICVPIRTPDGVLGALYLDNRFVNAHFAQSEIEILQSFADQVALALSNAKLHAELTQRTRQLEAAQQERDRVIDGQAARIEHLQSQVEQRQQALEYRYDYSQIIGRSAAMRTVLDTLERVIDTPLNVLITGDSGTGKELIARAIHFNSSRAKQPFVGLNCAALPETLLESQLFGHARGAFTSAHTDQRGLFVSAEKGTVFLDELGEAPLSVQVKLLRALEEREVLPLGFTQPIPIDIRLICATSKDLSLEIERNRFRRDLYYRVSVVVIKLPSLRERVEDIPELSHHLLSRAAQEAQLDKPQITDAAMRALTRYNWPGNVRELLNVLTRAAIIRQGQEIRPVDLHLSDRNRPESVSPDASFPVDREQYQSQEAARIRAALQQTNFNVSQVSRLLGIPRQTLYRKLKRYRIASSR